MAYLTGSGLTIETLASGIGSFVGTTMGSPWAQEEFSSGDKRASYSCNDLYVHVKWDGDENNLDLYQSLAFTAATDPWSHTGDSGNGYAGATAGVGRHINELSGTFLNHWFFGSASSPEYCHVVVEVAAGRYRHFGFGVLDKVGSWTGGEYAYPHMWDQGTSHADYPRSSAHSLGLSWEQGDESEAATMRIVDFTGEPDTDTAWGVFDSAPTGQDRQGTPQDRWSLRGGWMGGPYQAVLAKYEVSQLNAYKPLMPVPVFAVNRATSPEKWHLLGHQPDVAMVNMANLDPKEEITIGGDTWVVFPLVRKQYLQDNSEESWNAGVAYKKIV